MLTAEDYSISSLPVAPPVVSAWPERNGKPRVDLTQLHMNLALIEKQSRQSLDHSTDDERTADTKTSSPLARTNSIRSGGGDMHSEAVLQQPNQYCSLKRVRFSDAPPTVIVYEQVDILEGEIITRNMSIRRRNVDLSPVKNHKYEGSFSSANSSTSRLLGAARIDVPIKETRMIPVKPLDIVTTHPTPLPTENSPSSPPWTQRLEDLSPSTSSDSSIDSPLTPTSTQSMSFSLTGRRMSKLRSFLSIRRQKGQQAF